ncbi:hypothetical protein VTN77DRAFT_2724 [Rasamsonia byssochlamydoides]|uniref:uncharacterized protein n=1 Tax=Rasamsonia byssochlamydoides TaxID=89139 RepID=UPI003741F5C3
MEAVRGLCFLFNITPVKIRGNRPEERVGPHDHWIPPLRHRYFSRDEANSTGWYRWTATGIQELVSPPRLFAEPNTCSIFFDAERGSFLVAPADCSQRDISELIQQNGALQAGWGRVGFNHSTYGNQELSIISFCPAEDYKLSARGSRCWMPELIPETYDNQERDKFTDLAGELSILLGFAAFTCEPRRDEILYTLRKSFRLPRWIPHYHPQPSTKAFPHCHAQGLIVEIAPDPESPIGEAELTAIQNGSFGALIHAFP